MRRGEHDRRGCPVLVSLEPPDRDHTPTVTGLQPGEPPFGARGGQVVPDQLLVHEEPRGDHRADRVAADVLGAGAATTVAVEAGDRVNAAWLQLMSEHIALGAFTFGGRVHVLVFHGPGGDVQPMQNSLPSGSVITSA